MVLPAHHLVGIVGGRAEPMARLERSIDRALDANVPRGNGATDQQGFGLIVRVGTATLRTRFGYLVGAPLVVSSSRLAPRRARGCVG
jgi:hypothetical protein